MRKPQYSPSKLYVYQTCPRQYQFQYVRKLPRRAWANQSFGVSLHRTLQAIHEQGGPEAQPLDEAKRQLERSWSSAGYDSRDQELAELARGKELLAAYYETWSGMDGTPVLLEKRMSAPFKSTTLLGIVDRVDRRSDGSLEIIDYKSGFAPEAVRPHTVQQLSIYHYLIAQKLEETPTRHTVHYLASNVRMTLDLAPGHIDEVLAGVFETIQRLEADSAYAPRTAPHCAWCDYQRLCSVGQAHLRKAGEQA